MNVYLLMTWLFLHCMHPSFVPIVLANCNLVHIYHGDYTRIISSAAYMPTIMANSYFSLAILVTAFLQVQVEVHGQGRGTVFNVYNGYNLNDLQMESHCLSKEQPSLMIAMLTLMILVVVRTMLCSVTLTRCTAVILPTEQESGTFLI